MSFVYYACAYVQYVRTIIHVRCGPETRVANQLSQLCLVQSLVVYAVLLSQATDGYLCFH